MALDLLEFVTTERVKGMELIQIGLPFKDLGPIISVIHYEGGSKMVIRADLNHYFLVGNTTVTELQDGIIQLTLKHGSHVCFVYEIRPTA